MKPNQIIMTRREALNLSIEEMTTRAGLEDYGYSDIEDYDDEIFTVTPIFGIKRICEILELDLHDLLQIKKCKAPVNSKTISEILRNKGVSDSDLSDIIGIKENAITDIKQDLLKINDWVLDPVFDLARVLEINVSCLLNSTSKNGGHKNGGQVSQERGSGLALQHGDSNKDTHKLSTHK